ncbi:MAG: ABC transporter permease [Frankiales bacterium]|nr:ABC transporter permease [Frankiales bacterium]
MSLHFSTGSAGREILDEAPEGGAALRQPRAGAVLRDALFGSTLGRIGFGILVVVVLFCFLGPHVYHTNQTTPAPTQIQLPPSGHHWLGTDGQGYDEVGRLMLGGQSALEIGFAAAFLASIFGVVYGAVAGYIGGVVDAVLMRIVDVALAVPGLLLLLLLASIFTPSVKELIIVLTAFAWLGPARLVRGETLTLRVREFVQAAKLMGAGRSRIVLRHIIPNALGTIVVNTTFQVADAILAVAALSFLGLGLQEPSVNWGGMLNDGVDYLAAGAWWQVYPVGIAIVVTVIAFNFLGEGFEEALGVRNRT